MRLKGIPPGPPRPGTPGGASAPAPLLPPSLELLRLDAPPGAENLHRLLEAPPDRLFRYLERHRIDQLWYRAVLDLGWRQRLPAELDDALRQARRMTAATVLLQLEAARHAAAALSGAGVRHVFWKGIQLGEELYGDAVLRPAADVDVLIDGVDRERALAALLAAGFSPDPEEGQPSYQLTLAGHGAALDLHWHPVQPERCRESLTAAILASRRRCAGRWVPGAAATLVAMLLQPAVTDHVTACLIHAVDVDRWLRRHSPDAAPGAAGDRPLDWDRALDLLSRSGLKTAAWAMLEHTRRLFATPVPPSFEQSLAPGPIRRRYLRSWLERDPARLRQRHPLWVRGGFSLFLQDRPGDALRALCGVVAKSSG